MLTPQERGKKRHLAGGRNRLQGDQYARVAALQAAIKKEAKAGPRETAPFDRSKIKSLGLLEEYKAAGEGK